jgi:hypothetical protein
MKYLKYFEKNQTDKKNFKVGETVIYLSDKKHLNLEPCEIIQIDDNNLGLSKLKYRYYYKLRFLNKGFILSFINDTNFRKITKDDLIRIKAKKYNII